MLLMLLSPVTGHLMIARKFVLLDTLLTWNVVVVAPGMSVNETILAGVDCHLTKLPGELPERLNVTGAITQTEGLSIVTVPASGLPLHGGSRFSI